MKNYIISAILISLMIFLPIEAFSYIPPTNAYSNIQTQNGTSYAPHYEATVKYEGLRGIQVFSSNNSQTVYFNATLGNGTTVTPITCASNYQLHSVDIAGVFTCAPNNGTSGGTTLDTMQNITPAQAYVFAQNNTNINFQFRGINFTGSLSGSNNTNLITIHGNIYQNNTGSNLGSHGFGIYDSMSGSILQFLKLISTGSISIATNATNVILNTALKVNSLTCAGSNNFFNSYDNSTGNFVCGSVTGFLTNAILSLNGDTSPSQTINSGQGITIVDVGNTHTVKTNFKIDNQTCAGGSFFTAFSNVTGLHTCTAGNSGTITTSQNVGHATGSTGVLSTPSSTNIKGKNMSSTRTDLITFSTSNSTDIIASSSFKIDNISCSANSFVSALSNSTGILTCTAGGTGTILGSFNGGKASGSVGTLATATSTKIVGRNFTGTSPITVSLTNNTDASIACSTCLTSAITGSHNSIGGGSGSIGVLATPTSSQIIGKNITAGRNVNVYGNTTNIFESANNTAYARNIYSTRGTTQIEGQEGLYKNNTNTTMVNLKTIASLNTFNLIEANATNIMLNSSVPSSNVIDIYDQTIGDYSTPTAAVGSSAQNATIGSNFTSTTGSSSGWSTLVVAEELTGMTSGKRFTSVELKIHTAAGNVRVKVYDTTGTSGRPGALLAESNSIAVTSSTDNVQDFLLTTNGTVPANGKVWAAFETDSATLSLDLVTVGAFRCTVSHTYGAGPDPYGTCTTSTTNAVYIKLNNYAGANLVFDGSTTTEWKSISETHPNVYFDTGSAQILSGYAIYPDTGSTTCTQILIQTSTDASSWNTKRTTNISLLSNGAWNFLRYDMDTANERYIRTYCNDAGSKILAIWELKALIPSANTLLPRHGHEFIDSTNATLPLNR